ncbi:MAG: chromosome segregation protein SMC, partial [Acidobacteriota bacterium]|nr:chromosome segregation protein SMC [Acidobacteriota bacterium]
TEEAASRRQADQLRAEQATLQGRHNSLEALIREHSYSTDTVRKLLRTNTMEGGHAPVGVLADFLEVDPEVEKATEEFLHDELEFVVVRNWGEGEHGIDLMRGDLNGRATFLVEDAGESSGTAKEVPQPAIGAADLTRLTDALRWTNGLSHLPVEQLPRIANCFVTAERSLARELATEFPHCWFLTPDGVNYHGQAVSGGKKNGAGPLALKRELRDVLKLEQTKGAELKAAQDQLTDLERAIAGLAEELDRLRSQQQNQEKDVLALDHESRKLAEEFGRVQTRLSNARLELDRIARDRIKLEENVARDRQTLIQLEETRAQEEEALEAARDELSGMRAELARVTEEHASVRANLASMEERKRSVAANRSRLEAQVREVISRRAHLTAETERMSAEKAHLLTSNTELQSRTDELKIAMEDVEKSVDRLAAEEAQFRTLLASTEESLKNLRGTAQHYQEERADRQVLLARAESQLKHLEETSQEELNASLAELTKSVEDPLDESMIEDFESKYAEVRRKLESLGPVNPQALEEFEEAQQRQEFLTAQRQDLLDSIRDIDRAIQEIDSESRKRFGEAFHAINANFKEMFKNLFGGGTGEMRLTDEEDLAESGIDIVASPPGKRLQSVLLLSGGEKSLTAMALLMSIFQYTPSPFCILDEVDAPLDEPNIERLTQMLKGMATDTQFIVITHSKRTMEAAQSLYGVTMQEPGVSKLVSVRFEQMANENGGRSKRDSLKQEQLAVKTV